MTLQAALPRELYVDPAALERERERVLLREWTCVGRVADLGLHEPGAGRGRRGAGRVACLSPRTPTARCTRRTTCAGTAARSCSRPSPARDRSCAAPSRSGAPTTRGPTRLDGSLLRAPHTEEGDVDAAEFCAAPVGRGGRGAGSSSSTRRPADAAAARRQWSAARPARWPTTTSASLVTGLTLTYDVAANWKVVAENYNECYHCGPVHPELSRLVPSFAGGGRGLDWDARHPAPRGRLDLHHDGHHRPMRRCRGSTRPRGAAQGRAGLPQPDAVVLGRPRRGVRRCGPSPSTGRRSSAGCCSIRRGGEADVRPLRRRRLLGHGEPPGLGDLRDACSAGCRRGPTRTGGSRRWRTTPPTSVAGCCRAGESAGRGGRTASVSMTDVDYVVVGLGALGSGAAWQLAARGPLGARARAVRARPQPRRLPRHLPDPPAQLPHPGLRAADPGGVRRLGAARGRVGGVAGLRRRRARPVPARLRDQARRLRRVDARGRDRLRGARRRRRSAAAGRSSRPPPGHAGALPGARCDRPGRAWHSRDAAARDEAGAGLLGSTTVTR